MRFPSPILIAFTLSVGACGGQTAGETSKTDGAVDTGAVEAGAESGVVPADFTACSGPGACVLATTTCCGSCGETVLAMWAAVARARSDAYRTYVCPVPEPCPRCATILQPNFQAFCRADKCGGIDLRRDAISLCTADADCALRYANCCGCGTGYEQLVAVRKDMLGEMDFQLCPSACTADCAGTFPSDARATCGTAGHCVITKLTTGG